MKARLLTAILITLIVALSLAGCSKNQAAAPQQNGISLKKGPTTTFTNLSVPAWIIYPTETRSAIGIAGGSKDKNKLSTDGALEFAVKSLAMNRCDFQFDPKQLVDLAAQEEQTKSLAELDLLLIVNKEIQAEIANELTLVVETEISGYEFILAANEKIPVNGDLITVSAALLPKWCMEKDIWEENEYVFAVGVSEDANLAEAWKKAQEAAIRKLAQNRMMRYTDEIRTLKDPEEQNRVAERVLQDFEAFFSNNWFFHKTIDDKELYTVFMMLKSYK